MTMDPPPGEPIEPEPLTPGERRWVRLGVGVVAAIALVFVLGVHWVIKLNALIAILALIAFIVRR